MAAPNGSDGSATFRKLVASDIPSLNYLPLGGGTITGDLKVNSKITTSSIELYDATPYIDFHFDGNSGDYTSRIIENTSGVLNINGAAFTNGGAIWSKWITVDGLFGGDNCEEHRKCNCGFRRKLSAYGGKRI